MKLHRSLVVATLLVSTSFLAGCGQKQAQNTGTASSDSLLAASPIEQPQGQINPQTGMTAADSAAHAAATPAPTPAATKPAAKPRPAASPKPAAAPSVTIAAGTELKVEVGTALTSETAQAGGSWSGTIKEALTVGASAPFPAGSTVSGVVESVRPAAKGDRAFLLLRVTSIEANGSSHEISATADSIVAGSTRKRNVGAIAGGAAAGALLGKAIGGSNKGAVIGGILGGAAATGAVAASKGFQVEVPAGKELVFRVDHDTKVKL